MKKHAFLIRYGVWVTLLGSGSFALHCLGRGYSNLAPFGDLLPVSYAVNFGLAFAIVWLLYTYRKKMRQQIGFLFMAGSLLKFAVFFAVFYPFFRADGTIDRSEFASFFVPYVLALLLETSFTAKLLKVLERDEPL